MSFDLSAAYEALNPDDADYAFYANLATTLGARRAIDLGCGTGVLAVRLTTGGCAVVGVDPDADMLRVAGQRPGGERVIWIQGYADAMPGAWADLVSMSGHVSQVFTTDKAWRDVLSEAHRSLRVDGTLAFETRNPTAQGWTRWTREKTLRVVTTAAGPVEFWHETRVVDLPLVTYDTVALNTSTGDRTATSDTLAFRDELELRDALKVAGFEIVNLFGDWDLSPAGSNSPELIVVARRLED